MAKTKKEESSTNSLIKKPFLYGGISAIVTIFLSLSIEVFHKFIPNFSAVLMILMLITGFFFSYAFYTLGKRYNSKLLQITSIILFLVLVFVELFLFLGPTIFENEIQQMEEIAIKYNQTLTELGLNSTITDEVKEEMTAELFEEVAPIIMPFIITLIILYLAYSILTILFSIALIKISAQVPYAKSAGITGIIGICLLIFFIGIFVIIASTILQIMILFDQAKKFKEINSKSE